MNASQIPDKILTALTLGVMRPPARNVYRFGEFVLDPGAHSLVHRGRPVSVTPKVFEALVLLVENAGHVVEKEELVRRLWPDTFVGDDTLAQNVFLLRKALADGAADPGLIVTVPRVGYRFVGTVQQENASADILEAGESRESPKDGNGNALAKPIAQPQKGLAGLRVHPAVLLVVAIATAVAASVVTYLFLAPRAAPRVTRTTQLTFTGRVEPWGRLVSDGARLYFLEREGDHWNLAQISLAGGDIQIGPAPFRNTLLLDLSTDHGEFLAASFVQRDAEMPLWSWPVQGGPATRIGGLTAYDAAWHPNGRQIVFAKDQGVFIAERDGSNARLFAASKLHPSQFAWSPDGRALRFSVFTSAQSSSLWEVNADGSNLHALLPQWGDPPMQCCGSWSRDGRYFIFRGQHGGGVTSLWALGERSRFGERRAPQAFSLTTGEHDFVAPLLAGNGAGSLYAIGLSYSGSVVSYSTKLRQFTPVLPDKQAVFVSYSEDGQWISYIAPPDGVLWRAKLDGSSRIPLAPRLSAASAVWSPDGKQLALVHRSAACENKIYLVSSDGGTPRELFPNECQQLDPAWSPDGKRLAFVRSDTGASGTNGPARIEVLNLADNQRTVIPGSEGMRGPAWSPDGKFVAAVTEDLHQLMLYDVARQSWTKVFEATLLNGWLSWSHDGAFLYFQDLLAPNEPVYRVRPGESTKEEVVNFESLIRAGVPRCAFIGLAPDGSILATLLRSQADIFALDISLP